MKLLLAFPPFHGAASPPFGLAYLKGALAQARPDVQVRTVDWNLAFWRRWLLDQTPDLCQFHPTRLQGAACPSLLVKGGRGRRILEDLTRLPQTRAEQDRYMQAARSLDDLYNRLAALHQDILLPFVEDRAPLADAAVDALFGPELAQVAAEEPDLVGFSILAEQNLLYALALGRAIKERFGIPIALGGAMMSHLRPQELLQGFPWLDFVFFGEAEQSIVKFVDAWPDRDWESVPGLAHRDGRRVCVHDRPPQLPLDALAYPDFSDFPLQEYIVPEPVLPIITCRGCYWGKCTFCSHTLPYGGGVRMRRADRVIEEMAHQMERYGVRNFLFVDEAISPAMLRRLSQGILERGLDVLFGAEGVRVERAFDRELLELAHRAGLRWIYVGIESSVQRLLDLIEKGIQIETILRLIEDCAEVGITPQLSFIVGLPGTTHGELAQEIEFMQRFPVDSSSYVLLHGSPMFDRRRELGLRVEDQQVLYRTPRGPVHAPRYFFTVEQGLSPVQADALVEAAGPRPRMRPHLGEVHAVLLADTDFFTSMERPPDPPLGPAAALEQLAAWPEDARDGRWFLHMVGCLEEEGRLQEAMTLAQAGLAVAEPPEAAALLLHLAGMLNFAERPRQALQVLGRLNGADPALAPAACAERLRAWYALGNPQQVIREGEALLAAGHEIRWLHMILGLCYEQLGQPGKALDMFKIAEERYWPEPEINLAKARCLAALRRKSQARAEQAKAERKRRNLVPA